MCQKVIGGGNCQVSTTIYNAVKDLDGIAIIERHKHSKDVPYIGKDLDAAVAYGSEDLKFKNNNDYAITINISASENEITVNISTNRKAILITNIKHCSLTFREFVRARKIM